ncbi:MAG: hypothetical protein V4538_15160 [Bacteroidota bacterium]
MKDTWLFNRGEVINFDIPKGVQLPIYVIGDSHVRVLPEVAPYIFKRSTDIEDVIDSKSAYAVGTKGHDVYLNESIRIIPNGSQVLLSFGEIDCRHYVPVKAKENNTTIQQEVDKIIERYTVNCVRLLKEKYKVTILGSYLCPDDLNHQNKYTDIFQAKYYFNVKMEKYCQQNKLPFVPIFRTGIEKEWHRFEHEYPHYFNDSSHLGPCMIPIILESIVNNNE